MAMFCHYMAKLGHIKINMAILSHIVTNMAI